MVWLGLMGIIVVFAGAADQVGRRDPVGSSHETMGEGPSSWAG